MRDYHRSSLWPRTGGGKIVRGQKPLLQHVFRNYVRLYRIFDLKEALSNSNTPLTRLRARGDLINSITPLSRLRGERSEGGRSRTQLFDGVN